MEEILKKAIEGGYIGVSHQSIKGRWTGIMVIEPEEYGWVVLDPLFWQSLGKACGWEKNIVIREWNEVRDEFSDIKGEKDYSIEYALRFHEINLTEGWDKAVEYLTEITRGTALVN